jgi:methylmalonyl-CoA mutase, C-terminal domain
MTMERKIQVLVGKPGLDGHDFGAKIVARALPNASMEVIYTGLHQTPESIVQTAWQEDVDVLALSILSGARTTIFKTTIELMKKNNMDDILLTSEGLIPKGDMQELSKMGVGKFIGPLNSTATNLEFICKWVTENPRK